MINKFPDRLHRLLRLALAVLIFRHASLAAFMLFASSVFSQDDGVLPDGPGVDLVYGKCQQCHPISYVTESAGLPDFLWQDTLGLMKQLGMQVTDEEEQKLFQYLTTYLGTSPPPPPSDSAKPATADAVEVDGAAVYAKSCVACHGVDGRGVAGAFPPLVDHAARLAEADRSYLPLVVLYGVAGEVEIDGNPYSGVMPGWAHLSNDEIAAVLNTVTDSWGTDDAPAAESFNPYTSDEINSVRERGLSGADVHALRPQLP